jgi:hypothetical protein
MMILVESRHLLTPAPDCRHAALGGAKAVAGLYRRGSLFTFSTFLRYSLETAVM